MQNAKCKMQNLSTVTLSGVEGHQPASTSLSTAHQLINPSPFDSAQGDIAQGDSGHITPSAHYPINPLLKP